MLAQDVWACVKLSRMFAKTLEIGNYRFKLYVTDHMQQLCHEFDMNLGGYLGTQSFIPEADKNDYGFYFTYTFNENGTGRYKSYYYYDNNRLDSNWSFKKGPVGVPFAIASCGCRASIVHPIETVRRLPNLLQRLFLMKQNLLISVPHFHSP